MSRKLKKIRFTSTNGDLHYIYEEYCCLPEWIVENKSCDEVEAKKVSKREALKPLYLIRE
jgi:hypothetical protein